MAPHNSIGRAADSGPKVGSKIRGRRKQLGLTLRQLGGAANLSAGYLSQVERDTATPTLGTLARIAAELDVGVEFFITTPNGKKALTRAQERPKFSVGVSSTLYERLAADFPGNTLSSFILTIQPGYVSETVTHEGEEIIYLLEGEITQFLAGQRIDMRVGDSLHFQGAVPHSWANQTDRPTRILWVGTMEMMRARGSALARQTKSAPAPAQVVDLFKQDPRKI